MSEKDIEKYINLGDFRKNKASSKTDEFKYAKICIFFILTVIPIFVFIENANYRGILLILVMSVCGWWALNGSSKSWYYYLTDDEKSKLDEILRQDYQ